MSGNPKQPEMNNCIGFCQGIYLIYMNYFDSLGKYNNMIPGLSNLELLFIL